MVDELSQELLGFTDQATQRIDQHLLTIEDQITQGLQKQSQSIKESSYDYQHNMFSELTNELKETFSNLEQRSASNLSNLQYEILKDVSKLDSRIGEIESLSVGFEEKSSPVDQSNCLPVPGT